MAAEEEFDIVVDDKVAYQMQTVAEMIRYIEAAPKAPPRPSHNEKKKK
jgi:acyl carrier protein